MHSLPHLAAAALMSVVVSACDATVTLETDEARQAGEAAGFAAGQHKGYEVGLAEGRARGLEQGKKEGRAAAVLSWAPVGLAGGALLGLALLVFLRRDTIAAARQRRRDDAALNAAVGALPANLTAEDRARLQGIATSRHGLERALAEARGVEAEALRRRLSPQLGRLQRLTGEWAGLLARLRTAVRETTDAETLAARLDGRRAELETVDDATRDALEAAIAAEERSLAARRRCDAGVATCILRLDALGAFVEQARISVAHVQVAEAEALDADLGEELEALEAAMQTARAELATL